MNKIFGIISFLLVLAFAEGCGFETLPESQDGTGFERFYALRSESIQTKTALDNIDQIVWLAGDEIVINGCTYRSEATGYEVPFTPVGQAAKPRTGGKKYRAYYACDFDADTPVLRATQTYVPGAISNNPMYSGSDDNTFSFKNICGILELSLTGSGKLRSITVSDGEKGMSGPFTLDADNNAVVSGNSAVTLDCGSSGIQLSGQAEKFYVSVPAGEYASLKLSFTDTGGKTIEVPAVVTANVCRNTIYEISRELTFDTPGPTPGYVSYVENGVMPLLGEGHRIYKAGTYRYGASIIMNGDNSIDMWLASSGGTHEQGISTLYVPSAANNAINLGAANVFGACLEVDYPFAAITVRCPSWESATESLKMRIYEWKGSYASTVAAPPLNTVHHLNYPDGALLPAYKNSNMTECFPAGKYLVTLSEGSSQSGVWSTPGSVSVRYGQKCFINGVETSGQFLTAVHTDKVLLDPVYWDQIMYRHSDDFGATWTEDVPCVVPSLTGNDHYSCCDPGAVKFGGYYYIGYTSTQESNFCQNEVYMARSSSPTGPWDKWNGSSWGGNPVSIAKFSSSNPDDFGIGEPSILVKDGTVYLFHTYLTVSERYLKLMTADASDPLWPAHLTYENPSIGGIVIYFDPSDGTDQVDVKYCDRTGKFYAAFSHDRFKTNSGIRVYESSDGKNWSRLLNTVGNVRGNSAECLHNIGISGTPEGHLNLDQRQFVCYAYGPLSNWGAWDTYWQEIFW